MFGEDETFNRLLIFFIGIASGAIIQLHTSPPLRWLDNLPFNSMIQVHGANTHTYTITTVGGDEITGTNLPAMIKALSVEK